MFSCSLYRQTLRPLRLIWCQKLSSIYQTNLETEPFLLEPFGKPSLQNMYTIKPWNIDFRIQTRDQKNSGKCVKTTTNRIESRSFHTISMLNCAIKAINLHDSLFSPDLSNDAKVAWFRRHLLTFLHFLHVYCVIQRYFGQFTSKIRQVWRFFKRFGGM